MDEQCLGRLGMIMAALDSPSDRSADHDGRRILAAASITKLCHFIHDLIESRKDEIAELNLRDGLEPVHRHADGRPDDARFGQPRVADAVVPELLDEPHRGAKDAAELPYVLAHDD